MTTRKNTKTKTNNGGDIVKQCIDKLQSVPMVQTKHLCQLFGFNDGGKYMRRHLRKHFANNHEWNGSWVWKPNDKQLVEIVEYFVENMGIFNEQKRLTVKSLKPEHKVDDVTF